MKLKPATRFFQAIKTACVTAIFAAFAFSPVVAQTIDNTFGVNGSVPVGGPLSNSENNKGVGNVTVVQPDGKLVVGIDMSDPNQSDLFFYTYRYNTDGTPDATFGNNGVSRIFAGDKSKNYDIRIQPDGKIVVVGETEYCVNGICGAAQFIMMRILSNGNIDSTFGNFGKIITTDIFGTSGTFAKPSRLELLPSGKFLVCGRGMSGNAFIARLHSNGFPDLSYATNGIYSDTSNYYTFDDMAVNNQGEVFGLMKNYNYLNGNIDTSNNSDVNIIKLTATGIPDVTFGNGGRLVFSVSNADEATTIAIKPDQSIVVGGNYRPHNVYQSSIPFDGYGQTNEGFVAFVMTNGTLSQAVPNGFTTVSVPGDSSTFIHRIIALNNDRLMISGRTNALISGNFKEKAMLGQIDAMGIPKTDFNLTGFMIFNYGQLSTSGWNGTLACFNDVDVIAPGIAYATGYYNPTPGSVARTLFLLKLTGVPPGTVGISENASNTSDISIYPNPTSDEFFIDAPAHSQIEIYNEAGSLVYTTTQQESGTIPVNVKHLTKGIYFVSVTEQVSGQIRTNKLILK